MNDPRYSKKPIRYGLTPVAFVELGWIVVIVVPLFLSMALVRLVSWFFR